MVTSSSETTLGLSWVNGFDGNSAITGVRVDYTPGGGSTMSTTFPGDASDQSANLTSLLTFRTYTIRVHVMNDVGASGPGSTDGSTLSLSESLYSTNVLFSTIADQADLLHAYYTASFPV